MTRVTIAIPAFEEGERLPALLEALAGMAPSGAPATEFLVVDDGSASDHRDRERAAVDAVSQRLERAALPHRARFVASPKNRGKGAAIRIGWAEADPAADWLGFVDADGAIAAPEIWRLVGRVAGEPSFDVLAGSRIRMAGRHIERKLFRHLQGRVFATLVERLFGLGFYDTQCGVKLARAALLRPLLPVLREDRWLLDVELLAALAAAGARCVEEPIDWVDQARSKVVPGLDAVRMGWGLLRMRRRLARAGLAASPRGAETRARALP